MKTLFFLLSVLILSFSIQAQVPVKDSDVPEMVKSKLLNLFPGVTGVQWTKHNTDYHAAFSYDQVKVTARFAESGKWLQSESEYSITDCPRAMQKHITNTFPAAKPGLIVLNENKDVTEYRVELNDTVKMVKEFAYYDVSGTFLRKADSKGNEADLQMNNDHGKLPVHPKELPSSVNSYVIINYPSHSIRESFIVNNETYTNAYYVILQKSDDASKTELWFDFQGTLIKASDLSTTSGSSNGTKPEKGNSKKNVKQPLPESKVPVVAVQFFTKKEPKAEEIRWDSVGKDYVVSYYNPAKSINCQMHFDQKGTYLKSVTILNPRDLLPLIQTYIENNYYDLDIESAESIVYADKKKYILVRLFSPEWMNDPMVFHELYFSTSGRLEKEVLASFIDARDEFDRQQKEQRDQNFNDYIDGDDISLNEGEMVDGQIVSFKELPTNASKYLTSTYPSFKYSEGIIITEDDQLRYSVIMKREGYNDRKRILFDLKGNFLKEEDF